MIKISASLIKKFLLKGNYREICLRKIKEVNIDKTVIEEPTENMLKGLNFETQSIGSSAGGRTFDLPRKLNGEKRAYHERIDIQVMKFKQGVIRNFMSVSSGINTQVKVFKQWSDDVILSGEMDIFPTPMLYNGVVLPVTVVDLKLTDDLSNEWSEYCWGRPRDIDHTQMIMYNYLLRDFDIGLNQKLSPKMFQMGLIREEILPSLVDIPVFYWVFEHSKELRNEVIKVAVDNTRINELKESIRKVIEIIVEEDSKADEGWKENPSYELCKHCPLNFQNGGTCKKAQIIQEV